jgi:hypothetical protein
MPTETQAPVWICNGCSRPYAEEAKARQCEENHAQCDWNQRWFDVFPLRSANDTRWEKHCVRCQREIVKYNYIPAVVGPAEVGAENFRCDGGYQVLLGGKYCTSCVRAVREEILQAMESKRRDQVEG